MTIHEAIQAISPGRATCTITSRIRKGPDGYLTLEFSASIGGNYYGPFKSLEKMVASIKKDSPDEDVVRDEANSLGKELEEIAS